MTLKEIEARRLENGAVLARVKIDEDPRYAEFGFASWAEFAAWVAQQAAA